MKTNDLLYQIALTQINLIGCVQAKKLIEHFGNAADIFKAPKKLLSSIEGIGEIKASYIKNFVDFSDAEKEIKFIEKHTIEPLFITNPNYPKRLLHCYDAPTLLYYKGKANLNQPKILSIIGTRTNSAYGKEITETIIQEAQQHQALIISGLAYGIDSIAHKAAVQHNLATVGVLAHGLDVLYPAQNKVLAKEMIAAGGGLLTEFMQNTKPDKHNFPKRNRIVAGMCDAMIVIETATKGGSMITAEIAYTYNKDVYAVPGKTTDAKSAGCNKLIQQNKAVIFTNTQDLFTEIGWQPTNTKAPKQKELFINLNENEQIIYNIISQKNNVQVDEIYLQSGLSSSIVAACILNLELQNIIIGLPGKVYKIS
jgi:DNA processing protein